MLNFQLLQKVCDAPGAPGFEKPIRDVVIEEIKDYVDEYRIDNMGNLITCIKGQSNKKLALAAHMDEISFIVTHIDDDGFVRFHTLGGFDPKTLTAQRVIIHGKKDIIGVMGTKPIHLMTAEERKKPISSKDFFIDTGYKKADLEKWIEIGNPITRERELIEMGDCLNSKSLDNRISVYALIQTLRNLKGKTPPMDVYGVFTVQEEIGLRGAMTLANGLNPDYSIAIDTTIANDLPGATGHEAITHLGKGAAIKILDGMTICDTRMVAFMKEVAHQYNIEHQMEILPAGGTDTAALQRYASGGSIAGAVSIPTRYLHQVIEMVNKKDVEDAVALLTSCIMDLDSFDWSH